MYGILAFGAVQGLAARTSSGRGKTVPEPATARGPSTGRKWLFQASAAPTSSSSVV